MATTGKSKDKAKQPPADSGKQSIKAKREAQIKQRQQQQQVVLAVLAVALLVGVIGLIVVATPIGSTLSFALGLSEAKIPDEALTLYKDFTDPALRGVTPDGYPYIGAANAPHTIEEIASFSCPICLAYHNQMFTSILDEIKAGRAKLVYYPVTTTGDFDAIGVTAGGYCALQQGKFWEMQEVLYDWQSRYAAAGGDPARLTKAAQALGMDTGKFGACLSSQATTDQIAKGNALAEQRHMTGTPTIFIDSKLVQPIPNSPAPTLGELRGLIEAGTLPIGTAPATAAATAPGAASTASATTAPSTVAPATAAATSAQ